MGQLRDHDRPVTGSVRFGGLLPRPFDQGGEGFSTALVQPQLTRIGPCLMNDGDRLGPDQTRAAGGEPLIAAHRELVRPALGVAVAPFHWVHG